MRKGKSGSIMETVRTVVYAVLVAIAVRSFAFEPFNIPTGSMIPSLLVGDYLFVSKYSYGYSRYSFPFGLPPFDGRVLASEPERGDVAVFRPASRPREDYIKRIVGLPGDRIQMKDGVLIINDEPVKREKQGEFTLRTPDGDIIRFVRYVETLPGGVSHEIIEAGDNYPLDNTDVFEVPPGHYFMMGDNRDQSQDSRTTEVSFVPFENLIGRAEVLFFSTDGSAEMIKPWTWFTAMRFDRFFKSLR